MEGFVLFRHGIEGAEQRQRTALRRGGEREEREVALWPARADGLRQRLLDGVDRRGDEAGVPGFRDGQLLLVGAAQSDTQLFRGFARLRGVRLIDDHRVAASREVSDLFQHERELLERRDDDASLFAPQRCG
jgi:hypothetical protein